MTTVTATLAKGKFLNLLRQADQLGERFTITHNGKPCAILMGNDEYEGLLETLQILQDKNLTKQLLKAIKDADAGRAVSFESVTGRKQRK